MSTFNPEKTQLEYVIAQLTSQLILMLMDFYRFCRMLLTFLYFDSWNSHLHISQYNGTLIFAMIVSTAWTKIDIRAKWRRSNKTVLLSRTYMYIHRYSWKLDFYLGGGLNKKTILSTQHSSTPWPKLEPFEWNQHPYLLHNQNRDLGIGYIFFWFHILAITNMS